MVTTSRDTSRAARALKRAVIGGLNLAGVNVEDVELATVPLTRFQVRNSRARGGITVRLTPGDPDSGRDPLLRRRRPRHRRGDAAQDRAPALPRGLPAGVRRRHRRHRLPAPVARVLHGGARCATVDVERLRERGFKVVLDYSFGAASIVMPNVLAKLGAEVLVGEPVRGTAPARSRSTTRSSRVAGVGDLVARLRERTSAIVIDPDGETIDAHRRRAVTCSPTTQALLALVTPRRARPSRARASRCPSRASREAERIAAEHGAEIVWTKLSAPHLMEVAVRVATSTSRRRRRRLHLARLPARRSTPPPRW